MTTLTTAQLQLAQAEWELLKLQPVNSRASVKRLIERGWVEVYAKLFGQDFVDALAQHHAEAIEWHWEARMAFLKGGDPEFKAYFPIFSRGHMKSTLAERMVVIDALLSFAHNKPGYCLYICRNKEKSQEHIANIEALLSTIANICPELSSPQRTEITNQQRKWTSSFLKTQANYAIQGGTLDSGLAGSRIEETRPTYFCFDDIDDREDSPVIAESRFRQLTTGILPMKQGNSLFFFAQNLISRYSVMYRIQSGQVNVLVNRKPTQPIPAVLNPVFEKQTVNGIVKDVIVSGQSTWHVWDLKRVQDEIDTMGLPAFLTECQHDVEGTIEGVILKEYNESVHVISQSEFDAVYGKDAWLRFRKKLGVDWAQTATEDHQMVSAWLVKSDANSPLPNFTFLFYPKTYEPKSDVEDVAEANLTLLSRYAYVKDGVGVTWAQLRNDTLNRANVREYVESKRDQQDYERGALESVIPKYAEPLMRKSNVQQGAMSHERPGERRTFAQIYGLPMRQINPKKFGGVSDINRAMAVDYDNAHPFRPEQRGYTTWFMVVPDDPEAPYQKGDVTVYLPRKLALGRNISELRDSDVWRYHFLNWRMRKMTLTESGMPDEAPLKHLDDGPNCLQMLYVSGPLTGTSLTVEERIADLIPESTKQMLATASTPEAKLSAAMTMDFEKEMAEWTLGLDADEEDEWE